MKDVRVEVDPVGPADRSGNIVHPDLAEGTRIPKRLEAAAMEQSIEVQLPPRG